MVEKTDSVPQTQTVKAFSWIGDDVDPPVQVPYLLSWTDSKTGSPMPWYRWRIRHHVNATSIAHGKKFVAVNTPGQYYAEFYILNNPNPFYRRAFRAEGCPYGGPVQPFLLGTPSEGRASNDASGAFYRSARNAMSTFKGSVFASEFREARRMMWTRATKMIAMIDPHQRRLKRRWYGKGSKRARLKALSDSWLELQYGWLPLASDIEDAYKVLHNPTPRYKRVKGVGTEKAQISRSDNTFGQAGSNCVVTDNESTSVEYKYYGEVQARAYGQSSASLDFGFGVREFLPTAWEIIPWSFAVDYFTNVSDIINGLSYCTADFSWLALTVRRTRKRTRTMQYGIGQQYFNVKQFVNIPSFSSGEVTEFVRVPVQHVPIPTLSWQLPGLKQSLNLAALAVSRRLRLFNV